MMRDWKFISSHKHGRGLYRVPARTCIINSFDQLRYRIDGIDVRMKDQNMVLNLVLRNHTPLTRKEGREKERD